ncbi:MAG: amidohydrolase family protein [Bryobacterales bacterium]
MMFRFLIALLACSLGLSAQVIVLNNATVIDGTGAAPVEGQAIIMADGKIREMGPAAQIEIPEGAQVVDVSGKFVIPGIINLHGHVGMTKGLVQDIKNYTRENADENLKTYALYGVTTTTSMGTDADIILEIRDEQRRGKVNGARVFTALQGFTALGGYPTKVPGVKGVAQEVASAAQARARVDQLADKGADIAKMWVDTHHGEYPKISEEIRKAIIEQAHKRRMLAFAHLYELADAKSLMDAGLDMMAHSVRDKVVDKELISKIKSRNATYVPTLMREISTYVYSDPPEWLDDPFFTKRVDAMTIQAVKTKLKATQSDPKTVEQGKQDLKMAMRNLKLLADAGVRIGFGTDTGPPARFPGFFEHMEMELMVESGLKPMDVIVAFSKTASETLRVQKEFGTLAKGKAADLIVLEKNPLENIRNTRSIDAVYLAGRKVE